MPIRSISEILDKAESKERLARKRVIIFTLVPILFAILLIAYTTNKIIQAQKELATIEKRINDANNKTIHIEKEFGNVKKENTYLVAQNDSLKQSLVATTILLGKQVSVFSEFKKFIDNIKSYDRSYEQAAFWINYRMLEDKIRGNYEDLSQKISMLPGLDSNTNWIVIVESSTSLEDLKKDANKLYNIYEKDQIAIYQTKKSYFSLAVKGNGTFTRAYRLNVELRDKYGFEGAYFSCSNNWGENYLTH